MTRRQTLAAVFGLAPLAAAPARAAAGYPANFPHQDADSVREVVGAAHSNLERVRELVTARPALAKASWDWGFGDWESPLGSASHMGRADIAQLLIDHGARPNLFTHAMLGHLDVVRATVETSPGVQRIHGPHGITLLQHAAAGARGKDNPTRLVEQAKAVVAYLESVGGADTAEPASELSAEAAERYVGAYRLSAAGDQTIEVKLGRGGALGLGVGSGQPRALRRVEENAFAPAGAPAVRVRFELDGGQAVRLSVHDAELVVVAQRI